MKTPEEKQKEEREEQRALMIERFAQYALSGTIFMGTTINEQAKRAVDVAEKTVDELLRRFPCLWDSVS